MNHDGSTSSVLGSSEPASMAPDNHSNESSATIRDIVTHCPECKELHLDVGEWYNRPHKTHLCLKCGALWKPDSSPTRGVATVLTNDIPPPKRYAHHGKRRRSYTEELFRCQHVDKISKSDLVCNALLWKNRPMELRQHLLEHLSVEKVGNMTDAQILESYTDAKRIFLQGIPEDADEDQDEEGSEDDE